MQARLVVFEPGALPRRVGVLHFGPGLVRTSGVRTLIAEACLRQSALRSGHPPVGAYTVTAVRDQVAIEKFPALSYDPITDRSHVHVP